MINNPNDSLVLHAEQCLNLAFESNACISIVGEL